MCAIFKVRIIDDYNRLVYNVEGDELRIAQCKTHYENKR
ncbi:type II toxin-antitoxin system YoeB family toxin [Butyrivibrio fibrisolvens]